jgi:hypothetical protein
VPALELNVDLPPAVFLLIAQVHEAVVDPNDPEHQYRSDDEQHD